MTYSYQCNKPTCRQDWSNETEFRGYKTSCCNKCSNPECADHQGGCDCTLMRSEKEEELMKKQLLKLAKEGKLPLLDDEGISDEAND